MKKVNREYWSNRLNKIEKSKRKDCAEYGDCFSDPCIRGCPENCSTYNKNTDEKPEDLRPCECDREVPEFRESKLEIAHVTYAHWSVLCCCGALSVYGRSKTEAVKNWDENNLARPINYFGSEEHRKAVRGFAT